MHSINVVTDIRMFPLEQEITEWLLRSENS